jgi:hypothetical protein
MLYQPTTGLSKPRSRLFPRCPPQTPIEWVLMNRSLFRVLASAFVAHALCAVPAAAQPVGTEFTYQGELTQGGGLPATDPVDIRFRLFDLPTSGTQIGFTQQVSNITPVGGRFSAVLNFTSVFGINKRFLEIAVSPAGQNSYVTLSPRQEVIPTPAALHAVTASGSLTLNGQSAAFYQNAANISSGLLNDSRLSSNVPRLSAPLNIFSGGVRVNSFQLGTSATAGRVLTTDATGTGTWQSLTLASLTNSFVTNTATYVGIGRSTPLTSAERFGIDTRTSNTGDYGGMYISTDNGGRPFYGYNIDGISAWTYLDGADSNKWKVYHGGDRLTIASDGKVGIGTSSPTTLLDINGTATTTAMAFRDGSIQTTAPVNPGERLLRSGLPSTARYRVYINNVDQNAVLASPWTIFVGVNGESGQPVGDPTAVTPITIRRPYTASSLWRTAFVNNVSQNNVRIELTQATAAGSTPRVNFNAGNCTTAAYRLILADDGKPLEELDLAYAGINVTRVRTGTFTAGAPTIRPRLGSSSGLPSGTLYQYRVGGTLATGTIFTSDGSQVAPVDGISGQRTGASRSFVVEVAHHPSDPIDFFGQLISSVGPLNSIQLTPPGGPTTTLFSANGFVTRWTLMPTDDGLLTEICSITFPPN